MKIKFLFLILLIPFLNSCSDDDNGEKEIPTLERQLIKVVSKSYNGDEVYFKSEMFLENNRVTKSDVYLVNNGVDELFESYEEVYDNNDVNIGNRSFSSDGSLGSEQVFSYDNKNRLVHKTSTVYSSNSTKTDEFEFVYNPNNSVSCTFYSSDGGKQEKVFFINNQDLIYKESYYDEIYEVSFNGNNVVSYERPQYTISYQYDEEHLTAGQFLYKIKENTYGKNLNNEVLNSFVLRNTHWVYNDKLLVSEFSEGIIDNRFEHEFDSEGYLVKTIHYFSSNASGDKSVSEYFYGQ